MTITQKKVFGIILIICLSTFIFIYMQHRDNNKFDYEKFRNELREIDSENVKITAVHSKARKEVEIADINSKSELLELLLEANENVGVPATYYRMSITIRIYTNEDPLKFTINQNPDKNYTLIWSKNPSGYGGITYDRKQVVEKLWGLLYENYPVF